MLTTGTISKIPHQLGLPRLWAMPIQIMMPTTRLTNGISIQYKDYPPDWLRGNLNHQNKVENRNPCHPAIGRAGLFGNGLQGQGDVNINRQPKNHVTAGKGGVTVIHSFKIF